PLTNQPQSVITTALPVTITDHQMNQLQLPILSTSTVHSSEQKSYDLQQGHGQTNDQLFHSVLGHVGLTQNSQQQQQLPHNHSLSHSNHSHSNNHSLMSHLVDL